MISVVIPAHNEEGTIERCLAGLLRDARPGELEIVVACNGCTDDTAGVARAFGSKVRVLEMERASKAAALNLGDASARGFPRFYVDADIELDTEALRAVAGELKKGNVLAAAPELRADLSGRPWSVRAYYRMWLELPYVKTGLIGSGVYALSEAGRRRFQHFPDIIADDLFARSLFAPAERCSVSGVFFTVRAPHRLGDVVRRKIRVFVGNQQLAHLVRAGAGLRREPQLRYTLGRKPALVTSLPVYLWVSALARFGAWWRIRRGDFSTWDRDESTRERAT